MGPIRSGMRYALDCQFFPTMNITIKNSVIFGGVLAALTLVSVPAHAQQPVEVSTGYQDYLSSTVSPNGGNNLWYGSTNNT